MDVHAMVEQACGEVGILPPRDRAEGRWLTTDTAAGRSGKGDGRVKIEADRVIAWNWQTGEKSTVRSGIAPSPADRRHVVERIERDRRKRAENAERAAGIADALVRCATLRTHRYLAFKGLPKDRVPVIDRETVVRIGGAYLAPQGSERAIVVPARIRDRLRSCQLIWEDGTKKFLFGGEMGGAVHRLAHGRDTWLCEGFATGMSLRAVLRSLNRQDGILMCFSAANIASVAPSVSGRLWVAADHDKPQEQFGGVGAGEHYARMTRRPYAMPPDLGTDINDMHSGHGVFAVQRLVMDTIRKDAA